MARDAHRTVQAARTLLIISLIAAASACSSADDGRDDGAGVVTWCEQFDVAVTASAELDGMDRNDPGLDEALAVMQDEMGALSNLATPPAIAADWDRVSAPPPTNEVGGFDLGGELADAGDRIAAWALQVCDLSSGARAALDGGSS